MTGLAFVVLTFAGLALEDRLSGVRPFVSQIFFGLTGWRLAFEGLTILRLIGGDVFLAAGVLRVLAGLRWGLVFRRMNPGDKLPEWRNQTKQPLVPAFSDDQRA